MKHEDLPERWKLKIGSYLKSQGVKDRSRLSAGDFFMGMKLEIKFEDGSYAMFKYPLLIEAPEWNEVGVFTEHCGYHIFNLGGTYINGISDI